jgi:hypothetical protein
VWSCGDGGESAEDLQLSSAPDLPELARIGGVQDLWPFSFGFDATRETVRAAYGEPATITEESAGDESTGTAITWHYDGVTFSFFSDPTQDLEFLTAVRIATSAIPLRGGVSLGMGRDELVDVLGEPAMAKDSILAFFYLTSNIQAELEGTRVSAITLARALP